MSDQKVVRLASYGGPSASNADFADWLEAYANRIRKVDHPLDAILLIGQDVDGNISAIGTSLKGITITNMVGLLHHAAIDVQFSQNRRGVLGEEPDNLDE